MPTVPIPRTTQNSQRAGILSDMDQARERHPPILDQPSASIEEVVNPLDSLIQLRDPNPEPNPVHQPEDITDGERTPTGDPAQNQDPSTTVPPPGMTPTMDLASALALLAQSMAKSNSTPIPVFWNPRNCGV